MKLTEKVFHLNTFTVTVNMPWFGAHANPTLLLTYFGGSLNAATIYSLQDAKVAKEAQEREKTEELKEMMLQEIRRRPTGNEADIMEKERKRREELYQLQLNERRQSHESLLQVQEQLLKIFAKLKVCWRLFY